MVLLPPHRNFPRTQWGKKCHHHTPCLDHLPEDSQRGSVQSADCSVLCSHRHSSVDSPGHRNHQDMAYHRWFLSNQDHKDTLHWHGHSWLHLHTGTGSHIQHHKSHLHILKQQKYFSSMGQCPTDPWLPKFSPSYLFIHSFIRPFL